MKKLGMKKTTFYKLFKEKKLIYENYGSLMGWG